MFTYQAIIYTLCIFLILYLPRVFCWFASLKAQKKLINTKKNKFAICIPARNEGDAVLPLLNSLQNQTYDKSLFDVYIVVKDPNDIVIEYGHKYGAEVFVDETQTCKGNCLDYTFKQLIEKYPEKYAGVIIVDADCVLKDNFLEEMNNAMASGAEVINAKKVVGNYFLNNGKDSNLITASNGLIWTLMDDMGNRWKSDHGFTTMTISTGIFISYRIIKEIGGWKYNQTLTEDMEFQRDCCVNQWKTFYYSYAQFYMQEAPSLEETNKRRNRWMNGLIHSDFIYAKRMLANKSLHCRIDNYFIFSLWIVYFFVAIELGLGIINIAVFAFNKIFRGIWSWKLLGIAFSAIGIVYSAYLVMTLVALFIARNDTKLTYRDFLKVLFYHPIFYLGYTKIVFKSIFSKKKLEWDSIKRVDSAFEERAK